jgi:hypothetical protein
MTKAPRRIPTRRADDRQAMLDTLEEACAGAKPAIEFDAERACEEIDRAREFYEGRSGITRHRLKARDRRDDFDKLEATLREARAMVEEWQGSGAREELRDAWREIQGGRAPLKSAIETIRNLELASAKAAERNRVKPGQRGAAGGAALSSGMVMVLKAAYEKSTALKIKVAGESPFHQFVCGFLAYVGCPLSNDRALTLLKASVGPSLRSPSRLGSDQD